MSQSCWHVQQCEGATGTTSHGNDADELAAAMAAAAEAAVSDQRRLHRARAFAEAVWACYSKELLNGTGSPHKHFVHLIHELGMDELALKIADRLKVCQSMLKGHSPHDKQNQARKNLYICQKVASFCMLVTPVARIVKLAMYCWDSDSVFYTAPSSE